MLPTRLKYALLAYFSQPPHERTLYRAIRRQKVRSILEIGVGLGKRAGRMIDAARWSDPAAAAVRYIGIDLFESRGANSDPALPLKEAYRRLKARGASVRLAPGDPLEALSRIANTLSGIDLVVISADQDGAALAKAWFYVPRMLHARSAVFLEIMAEGGKPILRPITADELKRLAQPAPRRRAA